MRRYRIGIWILIGLVLAYYSHRSYTIYVIYNPMSYIVPVLAAFIFLIIAAFNGVSYRVKRQDNMKIKTYDYGLGAVFCFCFAVIIAHGVSSLNANLEKENLQVIHALEEYQAETGNYPEALVNLLPVYLSSIPECRGGRSPSLLYRTEDGAYALGCYNGRGISKYQYSSDTKKWQQVLD